jgi:DDE superfamily endonuclease
MTELDWPKRSVVFVLSADVLAVIQTFVPLFSVSVWPFAQTLLLGAIVAPGKRTVSAILRTLGVAQAPGFQNYHRVLNRAAWSSLEAARLLLVLLVETFGGSGPLVFGIDETIERRWGACIRARGIYRDAARSSKSVTNKTSGLRWLSVQLLVRVPWVGRIWALPFLTVLAPSRRYYQKQGRKPKKLADRARQALGQVKRWCVNRELIFLGDATYAVLELLAFAQRIGVTLITPLRLDAALFAPAPARKKGQKGRPRKKGKALPKLAQRLVDKKTRWQRVWIHWYGRGLTQVELATGTAVWYHSGKLPVPIRWVLVRDPLGEFDTRALLCTDPRKSAKEIVELYTRRWQVEVTFEEVRAHLGVETQRQWNDQAITRTTPALLGLFSLVTLLADKLHDRSPRSLSPRTAAWYAKKQITFSDALACVRRELWKGISLSLPQGDSRKSTTVLINHLADLLCYAQ